MFKMMTLAAALLGLSSLSAPVYGIREGGCVKDGRCPLTPVSKLEGKLIKKMVPPMSYETPGFDDRAKPLPMPMPIFNAWELKTKDKTYTLDLGGAKTMWRRAGELAGKRVIVTGVVTKDRVVVHDLQAADKQEFTGKLVKVVHVLETAPWIRKTPGKEESLPVQILVNWRLVDGTTIHELKLATPELVKKAETLVNKNVKVVGKLSRCGLLVSTLEEAQSK